MKFLVKITSGFQMLILAGAGLYGKTWTVDNNPGRSPDFTQISDAVASADVMGGDTLYVAGSTTKYLGTIFFAKPLVLIGPGFFLDENTELTGASISAKLPITVWNAGSGGSVLTGFEADHIQISTDHVFPKRPAPASINIWKPEVIFTKNFTIASKYNRMG